MAITCEGRHNRKRKKVDFECRATQFLRDMIGRMELILLSYDNGGDIRKDDEDEVWMYANGPRLAEGFCAKRQKFAAEILGIKSTAEIVIDLKKLQWIWDKRKTKAGTGGDSCKSGYM